MYVVRFWMSNFRICLPVHNPGSKKDIDVLVTRSKQFSTTSENASNKIFFRSVIYKRKYINITT